MQNLSAPLIKECPKCQGKVKKVFSIPSLQFKGSGFYVNDYKKTIKNANSASVVTPNKLISDAPIVPKL